MPSADRVQRVAEALEALAPDEPNVERVSLLQAAAVLRAVDACGDEAYSRFIAVLEAR